MRIRSIKPEFWQHEGLGSLTRELRMFAAALISWADDEGYFRTHPALLAGNLMPFDADGQAFAVAGLRELERVGFIEVSGPIGRLPTFAAHQVINRPTKSKLAPKWGMPAPQFSAPTPHAPPSPKELLTEPSVSTHGALTEPSRTEQGREQGKEGKGAGSAAAATESGVVALVPTPSVERAAPPPPVVVPRTPGESLWRAHQAIRAELGLVEESPPQPRELSSFVTEAFMYLNGDEERLLAGYRRWLVEPYVVEHGGPWRLWRKQWRAKVPAKAARPALASTSPPCARCGEASCGQTWGGEVCAGCSAEWNASDAEGEAAFRAWLGRPALRAVGGGA